MKNNSAANSKFFDKYREQSKDLASLTVATPERISGSIAWRTLGALLRHVSFDQLSQMTILDYGSGTGRLSALLAPLCKKLICADVSSRFLDDCSQNLAAFSNVEYVFLDGSDLPFSNDYIDLTISYAAITYIAEEAEFWYTIREIDRVSKAFALHLNSEANESPDQSLTIGSSNDLTIFDIECYRPSPETVKRHYPNDIYSVEWLDPDIRGFDPFFYKIAQTDIVTYRRLFVLEDRPNSQLKKNRGILYRLRRKLGV